jgi:hypothetical protein
MKLKQTTCTAILIHSLMINEAKNALVKQQVDVHDAE